MRKAVVVTGITVMLVAGLAMTGCETQAQTGALGGAAVGALAGQAIGRNTEGTLIGAGVGAGTGYIVGNEADKAKMRRDAEASREEAGTYIVNVPNSNGSFTPVTMRRMGNMWVGPQGEQYTSLPTPEQLRAYGYGR